MEDWGSAAREQVEGPVSHEEGPVARMIEKQTARIPSDVFLWSAGACIAGSLALRLSGRRHDALFLGQWVPTLLILGVYNKLVKTLGHEHAGAEASD
jgi:hypothetical protein